MKQILAIALLVTITSLGYAQSPNWADVGPNFKYGFDRIYSLTSISDTELLANGNFVYINDSILCKGVARFSNGDWFGFQEMGQNYFNGTIVNGPSSILQWNNLIVFHSYSIDTDTIVNGQYPTRNFIKTFDGNEFDTIGRTNGLYTYVEEAGDNLFAHGWFGKINGDSCRGLAKYNGNSWDCLDPPFGYDLPQVNDIYLFDNKLWVGGNFQSDEDAPFSELAYLDLTDSTWNHLDSGLNRDTWSRIDVFQEYNSELYIGGVFRYDYGNAGHMIMRWNPETEEFSDVGGGVFGQNYAYNSLAQVQDMIVFNDELWVSGLFDWAGGIKHPSIAVWDGENWCTFGDSIETRVWDMEIFQDELYILTDFINGDTINKVAKWVGGNYRDTCGIFPLWPHGVEEQETEITRVYPNPFTDKLYIASGLVNQTINYQLFDISGRVITRGEFNQSEGIDLSQLEAGIYLFQVEGSQTQTFKVLKQ